MNYPSDGAASLQSSQPVWYAIGILAAVFHFSNGMWSFLVILGNHRGSPGSASFLLCLGRCVRIGQLYWTQRPVCICRSGILLTSWLSGRRGHCQNEKEKVIIVGGGLAGLMAADQGGRSRSRHRPVFDRTGSSLPLCLRPGRHQRCGEYQRGGGFSLGTL